MKYNKEIIEEFHGYENVLKDIKTLCESMHVTMSCAESCTSGRIASHLGQLAGSSNYFKGGVVSYWTDVKEVVLGVDKHDIKVHDVVSEVVAEQMANGVASLMDTDFAIATTGYAGPGGGTDKIKVGTVCFAYKTPFGTKTEKLVFENQSREEVVESATQHALQTMVAALIDYNKRRRNVTGRITDDDLRLD